MRCLSLPRLRPRVVSQNQWRLRKEIMRTAAGPGGIRALHRKHRTQYKCKNQMERKVGGRNTHGVCSKRTNVESVEGTKVVVVRLTERIEL